MAFVEDKLALVKGSMKPLGFRAQDLECEAL